MYAWLVVYRRNRPLVIRTSAVVAITICGLLALVPMPGSGANRGVNTALRPPAFAMLLSPHRFETPAFVAEYLATFH
jgi:hypothetical protein